MQNKAGAGGWECRESLSPSRLPARCPRFSSLHGSWASAEGPSRAYHHLFFSTTHSLPSAGSVLLRPLAQRTSWPLLSRILHLRTWWQNADQEVSLVVRHCSGWESLGEGVTEGSQPLAKHSEDMPDVCCLSCSAAQPLCCLNCELSLGEH